MWVIRKQQEMDLNDIRIYLTETFEKYDFDKEGIEDILIVLRGYEGATLQMFCDYEAPELEEIKWIEG